MFYTNRKKLGMFSMRWKILKYKEKTLRNWDGNWCFTSTNNKKGQFHLEFCMRVCSWNMKPSDIFKPYTCNHSLWTNRHTCLSKNGWKHHPSSRYILHTKTSTGQAFHRTNLMRGKHVWWKTLDTFTGATLRSISQIL